MPRAKRIQSSTGIYHVMLRGINKQLIFEEPADYSYFIDCLAQVKELSGFKLFAYCLMGNHAHLLIKEGAEPLSQVFRRIGARYAFWFNWKYGRGGHLFQDRFRSEPVETNEQFIMVLAYIYQNPLKAGLCKTLKDYEWCSRKLLGKPGIIDEEDLFGIVPLKTILEREGEDAGVDLLEPRIGRRLAISDDEAFAKMKSISGANSAAAFQALDQVMQARAFIGLRKSGASIRQLARLSGISKGVVERLCRTGQDA